MEYSKRIKLLREKLILSQKELADMLDVSFVSVHRDETIIFKLKNGKEI